jgi:hypothetical protein
MSVLTNHARSSGHRCGVVVNGARAEPRAASCATGRLPSRGTTASHAARCGGSGRGPGRSPAQSSRPRPHRRRAAPRAAAPRPPSPRPRRPPHVRGRGPSRAGARAAPRRYPRSGAPECACSSGNAATPAAAASSIAGGPPSAAPARAAPAIAPLASASSLPAAAIAATRDHGAGRDGPRREPPAGGDPEQQGHEREQERPTLKMPTTPSASPNPTAVQAQNQPQLDRCARIVLGP